MPSLDDSQLPTGLTADSWFLRGISKEYIDVGAEGRLSSGAFTTDRMSVNLLSVRSVQKLMSLGCQKIAVLSVGLCVDLSLEIELQSVDDDGNIDHEHYIIRGTKQMKRGKKLRNHVFDNGRVVDVTGTAETLYAEIMKRCAEGDSSASS